LAIRSNGMNDESNPHQRRHSLLGILVVGSLIVAISCGGDPANRSGDSVRETPNDREPAGFRAVAVFGASDEPGEDPLWDPGVLEVVGDRVYVLDRGASSVTAYSRDGTSVKTFGSHGQGPGEFRRPWGMTATAERVFVSEATNRRLHAFSAVDGEVIYSTEVTAAPLFGPMRALSDGTLLAGVVTRDQQTGGSTRPGFATISPEGELVSLETIGDEELRAPPSQVLRGIGRSGSPERMTFVPPFQPEVVWTFSHDGAVVLGLTNKYELRLRRRDGSSHTILGPQSTAPAQILPEEAAWYAAWMNAQVQWTFPDLSWSDEQLPREKSVFVALFTDDQDRIWVLRPTGSRPVEDCDREFPTVREIRQPRRCWEDTLAFDVLGRDNRRLATLALPDEVVSGPDLVLTIPGNEMWAVTRRADGNKMITGYAVPALR